MLDGKSMDLTEYPNMELVSNLMYYDGPILDLLTDEQGKPVIRSWVDCDEDRNVWAFVWADPQIMRALVFNEVSLYDVFRDATRILVCETRDSVEPQNIREITPDVLLKDHAPHEEAFLNIQESERQNIWNGVLEHKLLKGI